MIAVIPPQKIDQHAFLKRYIERGFGALSKKEIDRLVFQLLIETGDIKGPLDPHAIARRLKITPTKAANLIYEYEMFQPTVRDEAWLRAQFSELLKFTLLGKEAKDKVKLEVRDKVLREEIEQYIRMHKLGPAPDYRLNRNLLEIEFNTFCRLINALSDATTLISIEKNLVKRKVIPVPLPSKEELLAVLIRSAAQRVGEKTVDLSAILLGSAGISAMITSLFS